MFLLAPLARHCSHGSPQSRSSLVLCAEGVGSYHSALLPEVIRDHKTDRFQLSNGPGGVAWFPAFKIPRVNERCAFLKLYSANSVGLAMALLHEVVISGISTAASSTGSRPWPLTRIWTRLRPVRSRRMNRSGHIGQARRSAIRFFAARDNAQRVVRQRSLKCQCGGRVRFSIERRRRVQPFRNPEDFERRVEGLRKAGLSF